jgi:hypothetical protein
MDADFLPDYSDGAPGDAAAIIAIENPFDPRHATPPFAGREAELAQLGAALTAPDPAETLAIFGRRGIGKTALLRAFAARANSQPDAPLIPVLLTPDAAPLRDEAAWLDALYGALTAALLARGFYIERLPLPPARLDADGWRAWLSAEALPAVAKIIRPSRRVAVLLDDAHLLAEAVVAGRLPADHAGYLADLRAPGLRIALAALDDDDRPLDALSPLYNPGRALRLRHLPAEAMGALLAAVGLPASDADLAALAEATGGVPALMARAGYHAYAGWRASGALPPIRGLLNQTYADAEAVFRRAWDDSTRAERLVLTAMAGLLYVDPLRPVSANLVEAWLVETDYPQDLTSIQAALRGLEYREIVVHARPDTGAGGLRFAAGLMGRWLMENARLVTPVSATASTESTHSASRTAPGDHRALWMAVALAIVLLSALLIWSLTATNGGGARPTPAATAPPTITLAP